MCGITAIYSPRRPIDPLLLDRGLAALHHRGPDYRGRWFAPGGSVALGHTLLAVTDLAGGHQPIPDADGSRAITVNGEFYGWEALRDALRQQGYRFRTESDSEVALHLHHRMGASCLAALRGEFAFVLWDETQRTLFAARDRYGIAPLLFAEHDGQTFFASEAKALFAMGVPARWDEEAVFLQSHGLLAPGRTLFAGVRQLEPGHFLTLGDGGLSIQRYWDIPIPLARDLPDTDLPNAAERLRDDIVEAVRLRVPGSAVRWGMYLSGGVDSSAVAGIVTREFGHSVPAYTIRFDDPDYDESATAHRTAQALGLALNEVHAPADALADALDSAIVHTETLIGNLGPAGKLLLSRRARADGLRVVLTGEGADETFAGYDELWPGPPAWAEHPQLAFGYRLLDGMPEWLGGSVLRGQAEMALLSPDMRARFGATDPLRLFLDRFDLAGAVADRDPQDRSLYLWARSALANFLLRSLGDGVERASSIEARLPLLDHRMIETAFAVRGRPPAERPAVTKRLLRHAVRPFLTDEVFEGRKRPYLAPPVSRAPDGPLLTRLGDLVHSRALDDLPFADAPALRRRFAALGEAQGMTLHAAERTLQRFASACVLQQAFGLS